MHRGRYGLDNGVGGCRRGYGLDRSRLRLGMCRGGHRRGHSGLGVVLTLQLAFQSFGTDRIDRAGDCLHIEATPLEQGEQLLVVDADALGEFVNADAHLVVSKNRLG
jgi:hypothetical protein